ncbi:MAG: serine protease [Acidobacteriota bacterium]|nr:serine protease [Acidobacteriota bacterium]
MDEHEPHPIETPTEEPVCTAFPRVIQIAFAVFLLVATSVIALIYAPPDSDDLQAQIKQLSNQVDELKQEQAMPSLVLNRYRNSICYIFGVYQLRSAHGATLRTRISGTGFIVANGLVASNRHVAQPWFGDTEAGALIAKGATPELEKMVAFFPGFFGPVNITPVVLSEQGDLAVLRIEDSDAIEQLRPLPLATSAPSPGELVSVVGYPMGVLGMMAKSPAAVYERLAYRHDEQKAANELAALSLIRPSATCGHLGDVVGDKLIYDAPTAHGGSGGPVFNSQGQVIGVNAAFIDGFSGGTLGVSVQALRPLIEAAQKKRSQLITTSQRH